MIRIASATAAQAGSDAALRQAASTLPGALAAAGPVRLVLLHADCRHDPSALATAAAALFPAAAVIGGSSCLGVMTEAGFHGGADGPPALGLLAIADGGGAYGVGAAALGADPRRAASAAVDAALVAAGRPYEQPALTWVSAAPGAEERILAGIADVLGPHVPVFGGSAADNDVTGQWWQIGGRVALRDGVAVAVLFPSGRLGHAFQSGYEPTAAAGRATAVRGRTLVSIDGEPAAQVYARWTAGRIPAVPATILAQSTWHPLARTLGAVEGVPFHLLAHPAQIDAGGALTLFAEFPEGERVVMMAGTEDGLIGRIGRVAREALEGADLGIGQVRGAMAIYCGGCMLAVRPRMQQVVAELGAALPGVPFLGAFTFGEQGRPVTGANLHGNLMISVVLLGD